MLARKPTRIACEGFIDPKPPSLEDIDSPTTRVLLRRVFFLNAE
jgi:hypothetical protein